MDGGIRSDHHANCCATPTFGPDLNEPYFVGGSFHPLPHMRQHALELQIEALPFKGSFRSKDLIHSLIY